MSMHDDRWHIVEGRPLSFGEWPRFRMTVNRRGEIYFNQEVFHAIGRPANVTLLFDPAGRRLAIKFPVPLDRHFHPVRRCGRGKKTLVVRAARMLKQFNMTVPETIRVWNLHVEMLDGVKMIVGEIYTR
jgi:hypothetical protein